MTQSRIERHNTSMCNGQFLFLYTATPPRGIFDSTFSDLPTNTNPSGHLIRSLKCVSLSTTMSNVLRNVVTSSFKNLFLTPFIFHDKTLKEIELSAVNEKKDSRQLVFR